MLKANYAHVKFSKKKKTWKINKTQLEPPTFFRPIYNNECRVYSKHAIVVILYTFLP